MAITAELVIARHGEAVCNVQGIAGGSRGCSGLTERGYRQARQLAERLAYEHERRPFDSLHTTPRLRVRQTAEAISHLLGLVPTVEPDLRGPDYGDSDGRAWSQIRGAFGGGLRRYPDRIHAHGAESWNQYLSRAGAALQSLLARHPGRRVLLAGHRETVEAAHNVMLGLPPGASVYLGFVTDHASLTRWQHHVDRYGQHTWRLATHNDSAHLSP